MAENVEEHLSIPRLSWESEHEWKARKSFLDSNKDIYNGDRLASLSMAWSNWKFMGCNYGDEVQATLEDCDARLPPEVDEEIRKLIDAATPKVKFVKASSGESLGTRIGAPQGGKRNTDPYEDPQHILKKYIQSEDETSSLLNLYVPSRSSLETLEFNVIGCIYSSCQKQKLFVEFVEEVILGKDNLFEKYCYHLEIEGKEIASGCSINRKEAKRLCAEKSFNILKKDNPVVIKEEINHDHVDVVEKSNLVKKSYIDAPKLSESNVGNKLLRKMGWDGSSGVGKGKDGIVEPVFVDGADGRRGVGHELAQGSVHKRSVEQTLLDFIRGNDQNEIKFSTDLTKEDRALVHRMCQRYHLKHKSYGKNEDRYLVVSKR